MEPQSNSMDVSGTTTEQQLLAANRAAAGGGRRFCWIIGGVIGLVVVVVLVILGFCYFLIHGAAPTPKGPTTTIPTMTTATVTPSTPPPPLGPCEAVPNCNKCLDGKSCTECKEGFQKMGDPTQCMYACTSSVTFPVVQAEKKGLCLDDTTYRYCPEQVHSQWANTNKAKVGSIRTTKGWEVDWDMTQKKKAIDSLAAYLHATGGKALVGTSITCNETLDDADWKDVLTLLKKLEPKMVMGVAVGNEMDLLSTLPQRNKGTFPSMAACAINMWKDGGYLQRKFSSRVADMDALGGDWTTVKVTSVLGGKILGGNPFMDDQFTKANSFFKYILKNFRSRCVFSLNIYSYFDANNHFDPGARTCKQSIGQQDTCFDKTTCLIPSQIITARHKMTAFDNSKYPGLSVKMADLEFWLTETGWSSPGAATLNGANPNMATCSEFSSLSTAATFYKNFLNWDMTVPGVKGPDHVFYFTMRDTNNFGKPEYFGLTGSASPEKRCQNSTCKIQHVSGVSRTSVV